MDNAAARTRLIADALRDGWGVEDIEFRTGGNVPVDYSRTLVRAWRGARIIDRILKRGSAALDGNKGD